MFKKIFAVILFAVIFFCGRNNFASAKDVYVGNEKNGDPVYLMTDSIEKEKLHYSEDWKKWSYQYNITFKSVDPKYGALFFGYTITRDFDEPPMYKDQNGKWQPIDFDGNYLNEDPNVYRAKILNRAYKYLYDNGYI